MASVAVAKKSPKETPVANIVPFPKFAGICAPSGFRPAGLGGIPAAKNTGLSGYGMTGHGRTATSSPILDLQSADTLELSDIRGNHHQTPCQTRPSYQDIVSTDWLSLGFECRSNGRSGLRISFIKR